MGSRGVLVIPLDIPLMTDLLLKYYSGKTRVSKMELMDDYLVSKN